MYAALCMRKRSFCKNVKFGSVALAFHTSCFNASLSQSRVKIGATVLRLRMTVRVREISLKRVQNLPLQPFRNPKVLRRPTMVVEISEDFQLTSKKFLATPLYCMVDICKIDQWQHCLICWQQRGHVEIYVALIKTTSRIK